MLVCPYSSKVNGFLKLGLNKLHGHNFSNISPEGVNLLIMSTAWHRSDSCWTNAGCTLRVKTPMSHSFFKFELREYVIRHEFWRHEFFWAFFEKQKRLSDVLMFR